MLVDTGEYLFRVTEAPSAVRAALDFCYGDTSPRADAVPVDFELSLRTGSLLRAFIRPQITLYCESQTPFKPVAREQAYPLLEWGMNWCIAAHDYTRFIVHAAVLERNGRALIFPAAPGSGKSTLTAYLGLSGWNLYSDEMAIIDIGSCRVTPLFRPVCLKNQSIDLVKSWFPSARLTPTAKDTVKGDVAHLKVMDWADFKQLAPVTIVGVVFPKYVAGSDLTIFSMDRLQAFRQLCDNAFNYGVLGEDGFDTVAHLIEQTQQIEVHYSQLDALDSFLRDQFIR